MIFFLLLLPLPSFFQLKFDVLFNQSDVYDGPYIQKEGGWVDDWSCSYYANDVSLFDFRGDYLDLIASADGCPSSCSGEEVVIPYLHSMSGELGTGYYANVVQTNSNYMTGFCGLIGIVEHEEEENYYDRNSLEIKIFENTITVHWDVNDETEFWEQDVYIGSTNDRFREVGFIFNCTHILILVDGNTVIYTSSDEHVLIDCGVNYRMFMYLKPDVCEEETHIFGPFPSLTELPYSYHMLGARYFQNVDEYVPLWYDPSSFVVNDNDDGGDENDDNNDDSEENGNDDDFNMMYLYIAGPAGGATGIVVIGSLICCCCCGVLCLLILGVLACLFLLIVCCCGGGGGAVVLLQQQKGGDNQNFDNVEMTSRKRLEEGSALFQQKKDLFEIDWKRIKLEKKIGQGGGGATVYKAKWEGSRVVAFKVFNVKDVSNFNDFEDFEKELTLSSSISHPNILRFFGCSLKIPRVGIVLEFCENGDLSFYVEVHPGELSIDEKLLILLGISSGMLYLHNRDIIHRDLKGQNVLLDRDLEPKLCDFGLSKVIDRAAKMHMTRRVGTSYFIAPEVILGLDYDGKCDVFSFSILLFEFMFENNRPFGNNVFAIENRIANNEGLRPAIPRKHSVPTWIIALMKQSWKGDPSQRPNFETITRKIEEMSK